MTTQSVFPRVSLRFTAGIPGPTGETSAATIEAREFVAEKAQEVGDAADAVAQDKQAVADDKLAVATDRGLAEAERIAAEDAAAAAELERIAAQQAVANPSIAYDTLSALNADLAHAAGTVGQVLADGTNNGFYVKSGASGSGSWVKKSNATIPGLDATLGAEVDTRRDLIRQETLPDVVWGVADALGRSLLHAEGEATDYRLRGPWPDKIEGRQVETPRYTGYADPLGRSPFFLEGADTGFRIRNPWLDAFVVGVNTPATVMPRVVIDGDSRVDQCMDGSTTNVVGWLYWLSMLTGGRFDFDNLADQGTGGENTAQILAGIAPVLESDAGIVIALMSTNDRTGGWTAATSIANMGSYQAQVLASGKRLIWIAELPRGDLDDDDLVLSGTQLAYHLRVREWILAQASVPGVAVADPWADMVDPADTQARARKGVLKDSIHESPTGAYLMARAVAPIIQQWLPPRQVLPTSAADEYSADNQAGCLNGNPMLLGDDGTAGTNATGDVATDWTVSATTGITAVCSKVTDVAGLAWQQIVVSGTASQRQCATLTTNLDVADVAEDDVLVAVAQIEVTDGHSGLFGVPLSLTVAGSTTVEAIAGYAGPLGTQINMQLPGMPVSGPVVTAPLTVPASPASASVSIGVFGNATGAISATIRVRAVAVRKIIEE